MNRVFDCVECGRHIMRVGMPKDAVALCAECRRVPRWYMDPVLRQRLDPNGSISDDWIRRRTLARGGKAT